MPTVTANYRNGTEFKLTYDHSNGSKFSVSVNNADCIHTFFYNPVDTSTQSTLIPVLNATVLDYSYKNTSLNKYSQENFPY